MPTVDVVEQFRFASAPLVANEVEQSAFNERRVDRDEAVAGAGFQPLVGAPDERTLPLMTKQSMPSMLRMSATSSWQISPSRAPVNKPISGTQNRALRGR